MNDNTALVTTADPEIAAAMRIVDQLSPLKDVLGLKDLTLPEIQLFAMVAHRTGLDPFTKQIYAIKRGGKVTHQTGIDGYRSVSERTHEYAGSEEATYEPCACGQQDSPPEHPAVARVIVNRLLPSGHMVRQVGIARWHELKPAHTKGQYATDYLDSMWWRMPYNQLAKCAEANGLRKAFPRVLNGVYIEDEMEQAGPPENPALVAAATLPDARERLGARRKAIEADMEVVEGESREVSEGDDAVGSPRTDGEPQMATDTTPQDSEAGHPTAQASAPKSEGAPSTVCGAPSTFDDEGFCGLPPDHLETSRTQVHRQLDATGKVVASWPAK